MTTEQQLEASVELAGQGVTAEEMAAAKRLVDAGRAVSEVVAQYSDGHTFVGLGASYSVGIVRAFAALTGTVVRRQPYFSRETGAASIIESTEASFGGVTVTVQGDRPMTEADMPRIVARQQ